MNIEAKWEFDVGRVSRWVMLCVDEGGIGINLMNKKSKINRLHIFTCGVKDSEMTKKL